MKNTFCCIFGAGDCAQTPPLPADRFIIAADGGLKNCRRFGFEPELTIGDFDSLKQKEKGDRVITLPTVKDDTDTLAAVKLALSRGYRRFLLLGCTGGDRFSHTVANLQTLLFLAEHEAVGFLVDREETATVYTSSLEFDETATGFLSVFAAQTSATVSESGLKYELNHHRLKSTFPLGVSNEFVGKPSKVTVHEGFAALVFPTKELEKLYDRI